MLARMWRRWGVTRMATLATSVVFVACQALLTLDKEIVLVRDDASVSPDARIDMDASVAMDASDAAPLDASPDLVVDCDSGLPNVFCQSFDNLAGSVDAGWSYELVNNAVYDWGDDGGRYLQARSRNFDAGLHRAALGFEFPAAAHGGGDVAIVLRARVQCSAIDAWTHVLGIQLRPKSSTLDPPLSAYAMCIPTASPGRYQLQLMTQNHLARSTGKDAIWDALTTAVGSGEWHTLTLAMFVRSAWAVNESPGIASLGLDDVEKRNLPLFDALSSDQVSAMQIEIQAGMQFSPEHTMEEVVFIDDVKAGVF